MQLYFFDVYDGIRKFEDQSGISLKSIEEVPAEVESLLRLLAYEHLNDAKRSCLKPAFETRMVKRYSEQQSWRETAVLFLLDYEIR